MSTSALKDNPFQQILEAENAQSDALAKARSEMSDKVTAFQRDLQKKLEDARSSAVEKSEDIVREASSITQSEDVFEKQAAKALSDLRSSIDKKKVTEATKKIQTYIQDVILS